MATDVNGGNWYRIWSIGSQLIVTDDDKLKGPVSLWLDSPQLADLTAKRIRLELCLAVRPLWAILDVEKSSLPLDIQSYEEKRMAWYRIQESAS